MSTGPKRRPTSTSNFGVGKREGHDASAFYSRFTLPQISADEKIEPNPEPSLDRIHAGDSRSMSEVGDRSVALVVTSPPYFAGKEYEQALGQGHVPNDYLQYLSMLEEVFAECFRVLEPGGRIAINVANLGRKPYRSLAADVTSILQDRLGMLLRGEIVWVKGQGASGSCAWGSFQSPANPVLRDLTERVIVACKGRFDRALSRQERAKRGLPSDITIFKDDFMEATTDVWEIVPESAQRVGHPAPFPVELPERLMHLYTFKDDTVLDPFMGSGSTGVAAVRAARRFIGYDTDPGYVEHARARIEREREVRVGSPSPRIAMIPVTTDDTVSDPVHRAVQEGQSAKDVAAAVIAASGFKDISLSKRVGGGIDIDISAVDASGRTWLFDVSGGFTTMRAGLRRVDTMWRTLGKAAVIKAASTDSKPFLVLMTTDLPAQNSPSGQALRAAFGDVFHDAIDILDPDGGERLLSYAAGGPLAGTLDLPER